VVFEDGAPKAREVDKLSADIETLCCDWRRMRSLIERIAKAPWWDLHTLCCLYCHAPFEVSGRLRVRALLPDSEHGTSAPAEPSRPRRVEATVFPDHVALTSDRQDPRAFRRLPL
jgi:hypothetical protein